MQKYTLRTVSQLKDQIKMLALDLDGTLLNSEREISSRNREAIKRAYDQGLYVTITTGRHPKSVLRYAAELGVTEGSFAVIFNGSGVISLDSYARQPVDQGFELIHYESCSGSEAAEIYRLGKPYGLSMHAYCVELGLLVQDVNAHSYKEISHNQVGYTEVDFATLNDSVHLFKLLSTGESDQIDAFRASLPETLSQRFAIMRSNPDFLEFIPHKSSKGTALKALCEHLSLPLSAVMAFGDAENDLEMLKLAGCGVAMRNALQEEILESADLITDSNDEDGVAVCVEQLL
ncbi:MAG: Cof-type HAD-IIB family hydrolase [Succinivibrio sp.]|nr:Cof-type HAD-IIB family hydrolase [Succinivibrio sp.]